MTTSTKHSCIGCDGDVCVLIDFGPQPPSNRFLKPGETSTDVHPLVLGQCQACGLIQLIDPMPVEMVRSRFPWITYSEPEGHVDELVKYLLRLPGVDRESSVTGLTEIDDSILKRIGRLKTSRAERVRILIARRIFEHARDLRVFLKDAGALVEPGGYCVIEVPNAEKFLNACDYSYVWEEHTAYFTPSTLRSVISAIGYEVIELLNYSYALEDSLVAIIKIGALKPQSAAANLSESLKIGQRYSWNFVTTKEMYRTRLGQLRTAGQRIAVFGAGHLATKFLNLFELREFVDCVIDDNPNKQNYVMPGSGLPIRSSSWLDQSGVNLCLLSVNPEIEAKVIAAKNSFVDGGGEFRSIFPLSHIAMQVS